MRGPMAEPMGRGGAEDRPERGREPHVPDWKGGRERDRDREREREREREGGRGEGQGGGSRGTQGPGKQAGGSGPPAPAPAPQLTGKVAQKARSNAVRVQQQLGGLAVSELLAGPETSAWLARVLSHAEGAPVPATGGIIAGAKAAAAAAAGGVQGQAPAKPKPRVSDRLASLAAGRLRQVGKGRPRGAWAV